MKFVDQVRVMIQAGDGGHGAVAFRREKYVDKGGPSGGDGGHGGSVIFIAEPQLTTLLDFRFQQHLRARNGQHGMGGDCNGKNGEDLVVKVPVGTTVRDEATGDVLADLTVDQQQFIAGKGGRGGLGNMNFTTSTRQTPRFAQDGTPGEQRTLILELKLLADVGLVGFPNAGKSTLISRVSRAKPKIADYPFTTLVPNLGVVQYKDARSFVIADIPGLIEGASEGAGLGLQFLRHVERCRVLVHLVDLSAVAEGRTALHDFDVLNRELVNHSLVLASKPQIVVANKLDLPHAREALPAFEEALKKRGIAVLPLSGATGEGLHAVLDACARVLFSDAPTKTRVKLRHTESLVVTAESALDAAKARRAPKAKKPAAQKPAARKTPARKPAAKAKTSKRSSTAKAPKRKARA